MSDGSFSSHLIEDRKGPASLDELGRQIELHEKLDGSQSILSSLVDSVWRSDENSLAELKRLQAEGKAAQQIGDTENLKRLEIQFGKQIDKDTAELKLQENISFYGSNFLKTASLFMMGGKGGRWWTSPWIGRIGVASTFSLDQAKLNDPLSTQMLDGTLGAAKGLTLRAVMGRMGQWKMDAPSQGILLGTSSRFLEHSLNRQTYFDSKTGKFDPLAGVGRITSGTFGGGAIFSDAILFSAAHGLSGKLSGGLSRPNPLAQTVAMAGSFGFANGVATELQSEWKKGKPGTIQEVFSAGGRILKSGLTHAAIDGIAGIPGGLQNRALYMNALAAQQARMRELTGDRAASSRDGLLEPTMTLPRPGEGKTQSEILTDRLLAGIEAQDIKISNIQVEKAAVSTGPDALPHTKQTMTLEVPKSRIPERTYQSQSEFAREALDAVDKRVRVYRRPGDKVEIIVPEEYARQLDQVRELRAKAQEQTEEGSRARAELETHPLGNRALPEDVIKLLDALPDKSLVERVILSGEANPYDAYYRQIYGERFHSGADSTADGEIALYRRSFDRYLPEDVTHEWSHILKHELRREAKLFDLAAQVEADGFYARDYATNAIENWPVHLGEYVLQPSGSGTWFFAQAAPVRAVVLGRALQASLGRVSAEQRSPYHQQFVERAQFLEQHALPIARQRLIEVANSTSDPAVKNSALSLLVQLGRTGDMTAVRPTSELSLEGQMVGNDHMALVAEIRGLKSLNADNTGVKSEGTEHLKGLPLEHVSMSGTELTNSGLYQLLHNQALKTLDISHTRVNDHAVARLAELRHLERLIISGSRITPEARRALQESLPETTIVD